MQEDRAGVRDAAAAHALGRCAAQVADAALDVEQGGSATSSASQSDDGDREEPVGAEFLAAGGSTVTAAAASAPPAGSLRQRSLIAETAIARLSCSIAPTAAMATADEFQEANQAVRELKDRHALELQAKDAEIVRLQAQVEALEERVLQLSK